MMTKDVTTFTLNPCLDKTVEVVGFSTGALNRIISSRYDFSGKGINLSVAFKALGGNTIASGFMYKQDAQSYYKTLSRLGIEVDFVEVVGKTRENLKVYDTQTSEITEINEPGGLVAAEDIEALKQKVSVLSNTNSILTFNGSVPKGVPKDIFASLISIAKQKGAFVVLDTEKELLLNGLKAKPDLIKPNLYELSVATGKTPKTPKDIAKTARALALPYGVSFIGVTLGADGAMIVTKDHAYFAPPLSIKVQSATGAGDTFVAGMLYAYTQNLGPKAMLRYGMAAAGDAVTQAGTQLCQKDRVDKLLDKVTINSVD